MLELGIYKKQTNKQKKTLAMLKQLTKAHARESKHVVYYMEITSNA